MPRVLYAPLPVGERFGRLVVMRPEHPGRQSTYIVRCDCGTEKIVQAQHLRNGHSQSCGCLRKELLLQIHTAHGSCTREVVTPTYTSWSAMKARCLRPGRENYKNYGGRGITVCDRWLGPNGFENFLADMGERPDGRTLDRIDGDGHYEPGNCRWATSSEQNRNRRRWSKKIVAQPGTFAH